jgi:acyl-homoserine lactone acylase PvdQ
MASRRPALLVLAVCCAVVLGPALAVSAQSPDLAERAQQPDAGAVRNILTPGSRGAYTAGDVARLQATGERPANTVDQLALYDRLNTLAPHDVTPQVLDELFKDAALGVDPDDVVETLRPREGVTVLRDRFGVPHVFGVTNADTAFGAGYAGTQDRMFLQDVLRHVGAARLTEFLGPSPGNLAMDRAQLRVSPYTVEEAERQITDLPQRYPGEGEELERRLDAFLEGINLAQREACPVLAAPTCPAEYAALQVLPEDWTRADIVYLASLVGGIFGSGGGSEYDNAVFLQQLQERLGNVAGRATFDDLMEHDDPEAPTTVDTAFPYNRYGEVDPASVRLPDPGAPTAEGSGRTVSPLSLAAPAATTGVRVQHPDVIDGPLGPIRLGLKDQGMSNALLVNAAESENGHPLAVFGPQVGYFSPQVLSEVDLHGPNYAARGASFAGTSFVVQLGRGVDYAWSATSANTDNVDTVAETLCNPDGSPATVESTAYLDAAGRCVAFDSYVHRQVAKPSAGGQGAPQVVDMEVLRTRHGIVQVRTLSGGVPVAYVLDRTTYGGEFDSAVGFMRINDPNYVRSAADFARAFAAVDYTFNWFYVDRDDAAFFNSGLLPRRASGLDPRLPRDAAARFDATGFVPDAEHAQAVNPPKGWMTSWNNKPAPGLTAADDQYGFGPVYRSLSLDARLSPLVAGAQKASLAELTGAMMDAGTADPRGQQLLPELLAAVGDDRPRTRELALLRDWQASGANRVDRDRDGAYAHQAAIALFDAWWEDAATTVLRPVLGELVDEVPGKIDNHPRVTPGGFNAVGWYGYVDKDLRQVLGRPVEGRYSRTYCGAGVLEQCRTDLRASLARAAGAVAAKQGTDDPAAWTYDKQQDRIRSSALGLVNVPTFDFQNRPTFQQVASFTARGARAPTATTTTPPAGVAGAAPAPSARALPATGAPALLPVAATTALLAGAAVVRRRRR